MPTLRDLVPVPAKPLTEIALGAGLGALLGRFVLSKHKAGFGALVGAVAGLGVCLVKPAGFGPLSSGRTTTSGWWPGGREHEHGHRFPFFGVPPFDPFMQAPAYDWAEPGVMSEGWGWGPGGGGGLPGPGGLVAEFHTPGAPWGAGGGGGHRR